MRLFSSLTNRIFVATAALAVLAIAVAVYRINVAVTAQAENELRRGLEEAGMLVEEHRDHAVRALLRAKRGSSPTCRISRRPWTPEIPRRSSRSRRGYQRSIGSDLLVVTDPTGGCSPRLAACACRDGRRDRPGRYPSGDTGHEVVVAVAASRRRPAGRLRAELSHGTAS